MTRASFALLASFVVSAALGQSTEPPKIRVTTWNLEWFPNGSAHDATPEVQAQRIKDAADVLRPIDPDIILLQEVRDYEACARLGETIAPGMYHVAICFGFKEPFQSGLGKQQVACMRAGRRFAESNRLVPRSTSSLGRNHRYFDTSAQEKLAGEAAGKHSAAFYWFPKDC